LAPFWYAKQLRVHAFIGQFEDTDKANYKTLSDHHFGPHSRRKLDRSPKVPPRNDQIFATNDRLLSDDKKKTRHWRALVLVGVKQVHHDRPDLSRFEHSSAQRRWIANRCQVNFVFQAKPARSI
jgi:hypothetical protein